MLIVLFKTSKIDVSSVLGDVFIFIFNKNQNDCTIIPI